MIPRAKSENWERASREEIEQAEDRVATAREVVLDRRLRVDARRRNPRAEPVDREDHGREEDAPTELGTRHAFASQENIVTPPYLYLLPPSRSAQRPRRPRRPRDLGFLCDGAAALCRFFRSTGSRSRDLPPAASIFSTADLENECAVTESFFVSSPSPSTFTSTESLRTSPAARNASSVTSASFSKRCSRSPTLTGCEYVRKADRHRVRGGVAAQLADAHVDRHLATLEPGRHLVRAGTGLLTLIPRPE